MAENKKESSKGLKSKGLEVKNTKGFINEIKNYDKLRELLRHLYMYGVYTKDQLIKNNLSTSDKTLNNWLTRFKNYIGEGNLQHTKAPYNGKQIIKILFDPYTCPYNFLADTYKNKTLNIVDVLFYYYIFLAFAYHEEEPNIERLEEVFYVSCSKTYLTIENLENFIGTCCYHSNDTIIKLNIATRDRIKARLKEFEDMGLIERVHDECAYDTRVTAFNPAYRLGKDIFKPIAPDGTTDIITDIALATQFFYNYLFFSIPGYYLHTTLKQTISYLEGRQEGLKDTATKGLYSLQDETMFLFSQPSIQNTMDDGVLWDIFNAMNNMVALEFDYKNQDKEIDKIKVFPIKVIIEKQYGRHYLYAYSYSHINFPTEDYRGRSYQAYRIDSIFNLKLLNKKKTTFEFIDDNVIKTTYEDIDNIYKNHSQNLWNVTFSPDGTSTNVLLHFNFPKEEVTTLYSRLKSQQRHGIITKISDTSYDFMINVQSEFELKPWIKSWGNRVTVDKETNPELFNNIKADREETLKQYGII